jgi:cell pole-organizing protein PopZ
MEEILASIRRILNDDEVPAEPGEAPDAPVADDDVLVLDETMLVSETPADHQDPEPEAMPPEPMAPEQETMVLNQEMGAVVPAPDAEPRDRPALTPTLVAPETAAAAASSVENLVRTLAAGRATQVYGGGPTLEDMVRTELRPLLKEWLDTYLPPMVERLVRTEIERVVGREIP